jgi:hypothetical protein
MLDQDISLRAKSGTFIHLVSVALIENRLLPQKQINY